MQSPRSIALLRRAGLFLAAAALAVVGMALTGQSAQAQYFEFGKNRVQDRAADWSYIQSDHFDVYYREGDEGLAQFAAQAVENAYAQVVVLLRYSLSRRVPILLYDSHGEFSATNAIDLPVYAESIAGVTEIYKNRIAVPFTGEYGELRRVLHHELVHAVLNDMLYGGRLRSVIQNNIRLVMPLWFEEGLAEYAAVGWDTYSDTYLRDAVLNDRLPEIEKLDGFLAYRGGQSVWDYIATQYGSQKVGEIVQTLRRSRSVPHAIRESTGLTIGVLSERWKQSLREVYYPEVAARERLENIAKPLITDRDGYHHASPALSPRGDRIAYLSARQSLFDLYVRRTTGDDNPIRLIRGQVSTDFEGWQLQGSAIAWGRNGDRLAVAARAKGGDEIAIVNMGGGIEARYRIPGVQQILALDWSPDEKKMVLSATSGDRTDLFLLDLEAAKTHRLTNDVFADLEPSFDPGGRYVVYHSDRSRQEGEFANATDARWLASRSEAPQFDLYLYDTWAGENKQLTDSPANETLGRFAGDATRLLFVSDASGAPNLYEFDLATGARRLVTDLLIGVEGFALSRDGQRAAVVSFRRGVPSIFVMSHPFERVAEEPIKPHLWAQRRDGEVVGVPAALQLASKRIEATNPFLRDAVDGTGARQAPLSGTELLASNVSLSGDRPPSIVAAQRFDAVQLDSASISIDFREADGGATGGTTLLAPSSVAGLLVHENVDESGRYVPKKYKLKFSPDLVYGTAGYDVLYGVQGVTQMTFSDMLGDHRFTLATNLLIDLRNADYVASYAYLKRRTDWRIAAFQVSRLLREVDGQRPTYSRFHQFGGTVSLQHPLTKFERIDADLTVVAVTETDVADVRLPLVRRTFIVPSLSVTRDRTTPGPLNPTKGIRVAARISGTPGNFGANPIRFVNVLVDNRFYVPLFADGTTVAFRTSGGTSLGSGRQQFYTSGVQNWINRRFDGGNGFPVSNVADFVFATPVLPLRGYDINYASGTNFALVNAELRVPIVSALNSGPLIIIPARNIQATAFVDVASLWGGSVVPESIDSTATAAPDRSLIAGTGFGLRAAFLGYPVRLDMAWPFDGRHFGGRQLYFSVGFDF